jgi:hypothetical protein
MIEIHNRNTIAKGVKLNVAFNSHEFTKLLSDKPIGGIANLFARSINM